MSPLVRGWEFGDEAQFDRPELEGAQMAATRVTRDCVEIFR
jgi:hypothetical protein